MTQAPPEPPQEIRIGACGTLRPDRNPAAFVGLAQRLTRVRPGLRFLWIGDGELKPELLKMVQAAKLEEKLAFSGWLPREEALQRLKTLDIFIHFSLRETGPPKALKEAFAAGLPVVASEIQGNLESVKHNITGLLARDDIELFEHVLRLVDKPSLRKKMGQAARENAD